MFRRRDPVSILNRAREFLSPRKGWQRGYQYLGKRMQRLPDSPHRIALGFACGVQASFTPFFGFHFVVSALLCLVLRGNLISSALGTFMGNPLTFPFIAGSSMYMGQLITGYTFDTPEEGLGFSWLWDNVDAIFVPYLIGGLAPGFVTAVGSYLIMRPLVATYQGRRRVRLMSRAKERIRRSAVAHDAVVRRSKAAINTAAKDAAGG